MVMNISSTHTLIHLCYVFIVIKKNENWYETIKWNHFQRMQIEQKKKSVHDSLTWSYFYRFEKGSAHFQSHSIEMIATWNIVCAIKTNKYAQTVAIRNFPEDMAQVHDALKKKQTIHNMCIRKCSLKIRTDHRDIQWHI